MDAYLDRLKALSMVVEAANTAAQEATKVEGDEELLGEELTLVWDQGAGEFHVMAPH